MGIEALLHRITHATSGNRETQPIEFNKVIPVIPEKTARITKNFNKINEVIPVIPVIPKIRNSETQSDCELRATKVETTTNWDAIPDDRRSCRQCRELSGRYCLAARRGELKLPRNHRPLLIDLPDRCPGYAPRPDDTDQRDPAQRWPGLYGRQREGERAA